MQSSRTTRLIHPKDNIHQDNLLKDALDCADNHFFLACQHNWEMYAIGASYMQFQDSTHEKYEWQQLSAFSQFEKCLAKGKPMLRSCLIRKLHTNYDPCHALLGLACHHPTSVSRFNLVHSQTQYDYFGFKNSIFNYRCVSLESMSIELDTYPYSRVEAAQIFMIHSATNPTQPTRHPVSAEFPGQLLINLSRNNVHNKGLYVDPGHLFTNTDLALDIIYQADWNSSHKPGTSLSATETLNMLIRTQTNPQSKTFLEHESVQRMASMADTGQYQSSPGIRSVDSMDPLGTCADLLASNSNETPGLDHSDSHGFDRQVRLRYAQYCTTITGPRARMRIQLSNVAKVSLVGDGASRILGRGILVLELSNPVQCTDTWPNRSVWTESPRVYIYGYYSELYNLLRRLVYLVPNTEGVIYRGDIEQFRDSKYHYQFPKHVNVNDFDQWDVRYLEQMPINKLWMFAEQAGVRLLIPGDADAFTIAEHLLTYTRLNTPSDSNSKTAIFCIDNKPHRMTRPKVTFADHVHYEKRTIGTASHTKRGSSAMQLMVVVFVAVFLRFLLNYLPKWFPSHLVQSD